RKRKLHRTGRSSYLHPRPGAPPMSRPTPPVLPTAITWAEAVTGHMDALRLRHYAPQTLRVRGHHLAYFLAWAEMRGLTRPQAVTRSAVERYQRSLYQYRKRD